MLFAEDTYNQDIEIKDYIDNIYQKVDLYISDIKINKKNKEIITSLMDGENIDDIAKEYNIKEKAIYNRIKRVVEKINTLALEENNV